VVRTLAAEISGGLFEFDGFDFTVAPKEVLSKVWSSLLADHKPEQGMFA
jgi:hypothetical protein